MVDGASPRSLYAWRHLTQHGTAYQLTHSQPPIDPGERRMVDHGLVSPVNGGCGVANISASMKEGGNLVISFATVTVEDPTVLTSLLESANAEPMSADATGR